MRSSSLASKAYPIVVALILFLGFALRVNALEADAPLHTSLYYGLTNDGAATVGPARDRIIFNTWWPSWEFGNLYRTLPGMAWLGYFTFRLIGVGYWQASFIVVK